jgi:hypothetical protein
MSTVTDARRTATAGRPVTWWERETRIGRHLYPLRAIAVAVGAGAVTAVVAVLAAVALLVD